MQRDTPFVWPFHASWRNACTAIVKWQSRSSFPLNRLRNSIVAECYCRFSFRARTPPCLTSLCSRDSGRLRRSARPTAFVVLFQDSTRGVRFSPRGTWLLCNLYIRTSPRRDARGIDCDPGKSRGRWDLHCDVVACVITFDLCLDSETIKACIHVCVAVDLFSVRKQRWDDVTCWWRHCIRRKQYVRSS